MTYKFLIDNSTLIPCGKMTGMTENANTYICDFEIKADFENLSWFCVFKAEEKTYVTPVSGNRCTIPLEVLKKEGSVAIGCYAISNDDVRRISTNFVWFEVLQGAFGKGNVPEPPELGFWERLVFSALPKISEAGTWLVYDMASGCYKDTGVVAIGNDGYTPVRETDYWTPEDREGIKSYIDECTAEIDEKEDKSVILSNPYDEEYIFEFLNLENKEMRLGEVANISFVFGDGEYANDYSSGLAFDSGDIPTSIDYTGSGILNWVGTDCAMQDGLSVFEPSKNKHYDILFYFNGTQFVAMVNGFAVSKAQGL